jgi:hypothetical protein
VNLNEQSAGENAGGVSLSAMCVILVEFLFIHCVPVTPVGHPHEQAAVPLPAGARPQGDGAVELWLEKKSPSVMKGWQRRWFVLHPSGEVFYFTDPSKEKKMTLNGTKQQFWLSDCQRFGSENKHQGLFDLHFAATGKVMQLRVPERTAVALEAVQDILSTMKINGVLAVDNDGLIKEGFDDVKEGSDEVTPAAQEEQQAGTESAPAPPAWSVSGRSDVMHARSYVAPNLRPGYVGTAVALPGAVHSGNTADAAAAASLASQWQQMQADDDDI